MNKNLLFICGANGIGKTTISKVLLGKIPNSAYVDSDCCRMMNPFSINDETIPTMQGNIAALIRNYMKCSAVQTVIFSYGFHGRRREIFDGVINSISDIEYRFLPFLLTCNEEENVRRMRCDNRDTDRVKRALDVSRLAYEEIPYPQIDITNLSPEESADEVLYKAGLDSK